jgi:hypothetical protein
MNSTEKLTTVTTVRSGQEVLWWRAASPNQTGLTPEVTLAPSLIKLAGRLSRQGPRRLRTLQVSQPFLGPTRLHPITDHELAELRLIVCGLEHRKPSRRQPKE